MLRFLFGDDIFISYSRKDGTNYAAALANELSKPERGLSCFLDQWGASAGEELSRPVNNALRRCSVLVLAATPGIAGSAAVKQEVEEFSRRTWLRGHRPILLIGFGDTLKELDWKTLTGLARTSESEEARAGGVPSEAVVRLIANSHTYTRRNQRVRWLSIGALMLLAASVAGGLTAWRQSDLAAKNQAKAENAAIGAHRTERKARQNASDARENARKFETSAAEALANQQTAEEQETIARANARTANAQEIASLAVAQRNINPDLSLALIDEALKLAPDTSQVIDTLRLLVAGTRMQRVLRTGAVVRTAEYSPDGQTIVTAGSHATMHVWRTATQKIARVIHGKASDIRAAISPDGGSIATAGDRSVQIWRMSTGELLREFRLDRDVAEAASWSPDGTLLIIGKQIRSASTGELVMNVPGQITHAVFSPDGRFIAAACGGHKACVLDVSTGDLQWEREGHTNDITTVAYSPDGQFIATAGLDTTARIWSAAKGESLARIEPHLDYLRSIAFSPDGELIAIGGNGGAVIFGTRNRELVAELKGHFSFVESIRFSPDGTSIVTGSQDGTARVWRVAPDPEGEIRVAGAECLNATVSPDSRFILTMHNDNSIRIWDAATRRPLGQLKTDKATATGPAAYSPDGRLIAANDVDGPVRIWLAATREVSEILGSSGQTHCIAWSPNGELIATQEGGQTKLWRASTRELLGILPDPSLDEFRTAVFSPDGQHVMTIVNRDLENVLKGTDLGGTVKIWHLASRTMLGELPGHGAHINSAVYSTDGQLILTSCNDNKIRIWRAATRTLAGEIEESDAYGQPAAFSPDGQYIVAGCNSTARVWRTATREVVAELKGYAGLITDVSFSRDGQSIITVNAGVARVWPLPFFMPATELSERLRRLSPRPLDRDERKLYVREPTGNAPIRPTSPAPSPVPSRAARSSPAPARR